MTQMTDGSDDPRSLTRRQALAGAGAVGTLALLARNPALYAASGQLLAAAGPARTLSEGESKILVELCEAMVPGARAASVGRYLDYQLSLPTDSCLLFARYLPIAPPYLTFYRRGLASIQTAAARLGRTHERELTAEQWCQLALRLFQKTLGDWDGPPSDILYFALRNDALDVTYSTDEGLKKLGIPIMHHSHSTAPPFDRER
jgi:hypothetical protein